MQDGWKVPASKAIRAKIAALYRTSTQLDRNLAAETRRNHPQSIANQIESQIRVVKLHSRYLRPVLLYVQDFAEAIDKLWDLLLAWRGNLENLRRRIYLASSLHDGAALSEAQRVCDDLQEMLQDNLVAMRELMGSLIEATGDVRNTTNPQ